MYDWLVYFGGFFAFLLSMAVGANDVANSFASSVGSKVLTLRQAFVLGAIFEFLGAFFLGSRVIDTMRKSIADLECFEANPEILMYGMFSVLIGVWIWLTFATYMGLPVSTTHSCVGGIVGMVMISRGTGCIVWQSSNFAKGVFGILLSWLISPILSGLISSSLYGILRCYVLTKNDSHRRARLIFPLLVFFTVLINTFFIIYKGAKGLNLHKMDIWMSIVISIGSATFFTLIATPIMYRYTRIQPEQNLPTPPDPHNTEINTDTSSSTESLYQYDNQNNNDIEDHNQQDIVEKWDPETEKVFNKLQVFTAICEAFAHGANDVANAIGPYVALYIIWKNGIAESKNDMGMDSYWILGFGGLGIALGLVLFGEKIINVLGNKACKITASRGFSIELATTLVILTGSRLGLPLSTTHCQVGATYSVGLFDRKNLDCKLFAKIIFGWVITLILAGGLSAVITAQGIYAPSTYCVKYGNTTVFRDKQFL